MKRALVLAAVLALGCAGGPFTIAVGIARAICRALPPETSAAARGRRVEAVEVAADGGVRLVYGPGAP